MPSSARETSDPETDAPLEAAELRRTLQGLRTEVRGRVFTVKLLLCLGLVLGGALLALHPAPWSRIAGVLLIGCMFAHAAELQHEALHNLAYRSPRANRAVGIAVGLPMLISFTAYRVTHMRHHRDLGTPMNREFFDYGNQYGEAGPRSRTAVGLSWCVRFSMVHHYAQFAKYLARSLRGRDFEGENALTSRRIRREHLVALAAILALSAGSIPAGQALVLWVWLLPLVLVAAPLHALIELPEHYGCETLDRSPFANTRTIRSNALMTWFTNGNNFHVEHHLGPNLPIGRLPDLHAQLEGRLRHYHTGYFDYFSKLLRHK